MSVCLKDKVTQPSSPLKYSTELHVASPLLKHYSDDGLVPTKPVLVVVSDGGPDHRITYASVQVALLCLFISLMLVVGHTCPHQSWH